MQERVVRRGKRKDANVVDTKSKFRKFCGFRVLWRHPLIFLATVTALFMLSILVSYNSIHDKQYKKDQELPKTESLRTTKTNQYVKSMDNPILLWWTTYGGKADDDITCGDLKCEIRIDRNLKDHRDTKAILFYGTGMDLTDMPLPRRFDQIWALSHEESPKNNDFLFSHEEIVTLFNFTSTFKRESDYPCPTQFLPNLYYIMDKTYFVDTEKKNDLKEKENLAPVLYIQSDCGASSDRDHYMKLLEKYIKVDSYGTCNNNKQLPKKLQFGDSMAGMHHEDFFKLAAKYKFTLAMENAVCDDYITEKVWRPFHLGSVPVIFGSSKIEDFLPGNRTAILIKDFKNIQELAQYLHHLDTHDNEYNEYLTYKTEQRIENRYLIKHMSEREWGSSSPILNKHKQFSSHFHGFECFICRKSHNMLEDESRGLTQKSWTASKEHYGCPPPKRFNENGEHIVNDKWFAEPWFYSKYLAKAFRYFYDGFKYNFTEAELLHLSKELRKKDEIR